MRPSLQLSQVFRAARVLGLSAGPLTRRGDPRGDPIAIVERAVALVCHPDGFGSTGMGRHIYGPPRFARGFVSVRVERVGCGHISGLRERRFTQPLLRRGCQPVRQLAPGALMGSAHAHLNKGTVSRTLVAFRLRACRSNTSLPSLRLHSLQPLAGVAACRGDRAPLSCRASDGRKLASGRRQALRHGWRRVTRRAVAQRRSRAAA